MKVVMMCKWSNDVSGGVAVHVKNLINELSNSNHLDLYVISFGNSSEVYYEGTAKIIILKAHNMYHYIPFLAIIKLALEVKKIKPDIIHLQGSNVSPYLLYALLEKGCKKVVTYHSYPSRELVAHGRLKKNSFKYKFLRYLERYTALKMDYNITVDTRLKKWLIEEFGNQMKNKTDVILNGVDINKFNYKIDKTKKKEMLGIKKGDIVILHAKAFVPKNGQEYLIKALPKILNEFPNTKLILVGDGPQKNKMIKLSNDLGISSNIRFDGDIANDLIPDYMAAADIVIVPSIHINGLEEASSILLVEAMAMKKAVIATEIGGLKESIIDGFNGILITDKDPESISHNTLRILNDPDLSIFLGKNAFEYVKTKRTWPKIALETLNVYKKIMN